MIDNLSEEREKGEEVKKPLSCKIKFKKYFSQRSPIVMMKANTRRRWIARALSHQVSTHYTTYVLSYYHDTREKRGEAFLKFSARKEIMLIVQLGERAVMQRTYKHTYLHATSMMG